MFKLKVITLLKVNAIATLAFFIIIFNTFNNIKFINYEIRALENTYYQLGNDLDHLTYMKAEQHQLVMDYAINQKRGILALYTKSQQRTEEVLDALASSPTKAEGVFIDANILKWIDELLTVNSNMYDLVYNTTYSPQGAEASKNLSAINQYRGYTDFFWKRIVKIKKEFNDDFKEQSRLLFERQKSLTHWLSVFSIAVIALLITSLYFLVLHVAKPIKRIANQMATSSATRGQLSKISEVALLEKTYNTLIIANNNHQHTLQQKATELVALAKTAKEADTAKGLFVATISHELRNPLNIISGSIPLIHTKDDTINDMLADVTVASNMMLSIVNDVLDYSKISEGKMKTAPTKVNTEVLIDNIITHNSALFKQGNILFTFESKGDIPTTIFTDKIRLIQIITNMVFNAHKFTKQGEVKVRLKAVGTSLQWTISDTGKGMSKAALKVITQPYQQEEGEGYQQGYGLGMAIALALTKSLGGQFTLKSTANKGTVIMLTFANHHPDTPARYTLQTVVKISSQTPFLAGKVKKLLVSLSNQLEYTLINEKIEHQRTCLYLGPNNAAITEQPTKTIAVNIKAGKTEGEETDVHDSDTTPNTLTLTWPLNPATVLRLVCSPNIPSEHLELQSTEQLTARPTVALAKLKVLVAEDVMLNQKLLARMLAPHNVLLTFANNGLEAVNLVTSTHFDCVLMDINMPVMNGIEATKKIRAMFTKAQLPIFAITGNTTENETSNTLKAGVNSVFIKPFTYNDIITALQDVKA